jgi:hypothetical protein
MADALKGTSRILSWRNTAHAMGLDPATSARGMLSISSAEKRRRGRADYEWWRYQRSDVISPDSNTAVPYMRKNGIQFRQYLRADGTPMYQVDMERHSMNLAESRDLFRQVRGGRH